MKKILSLLIASCLVFSTLAFSDDSLTVPFRPSDISTGLVGYWKFDNNANDSSASGYNLTAVNSPTYTQTDYWKSGEYSAGLEQDSSQYFTITDASCPNLRISGSAVTVVGWIKMESDNPQYIGKWHNDGNKNYLLYYSASTKGLEFITTTDGATNRLCTGGLTLSIGKWHHIAGVYDGVTERTYLDGNLSAVLPATGNIYGSSNHPFSIGEANETQIFADGLFKDVAVWNIALTPLQIKSLALGIDLTNYAYRPDDVSTQPTHWWKLNEVSGNRVDSVATNPLALSPQGTNGSSGGYVEGVSYDFNGTNTYGLTVDSADWNWDGGIWSASFRIKADALAGDMSLFGRYTDASNYCHMNLSSAGTLSFVAVTGGSTIVNVISNAGVIKTDVWYHIVMRENGDTWGILVDGIDQTASGGTDTSRLIDYSNGFFVGALLTYFNGKIEDFSVWKTYALTDAEIKSLACALPIQRQGIVSYWKEEDLTDSIGSNHLTDHASVTYPSGKVGNAGNFVAASSQYQSLAHNASIDIASDMTILGWFKPSGVGVNQYLIARNQNTVGYTANITTGNKLNFGLGSSELAGATSVADGVYVHYVGYYDGATQKVFYNAVQDATTAWTTNPSEATTGLNIGADGGASTFTNGQIDELILAKRYFRPEEIKAVYLKGLNSKEITSSELSPTSRRIFIS